MTFRSLIIFIFIAVFTSSCVVYSFTGASISPDIKTMSIQYFYNDSGNGPPNLQQTFTEEIRDYYQQNTSLELVESNGDLQLEGSITGYRVQPIAVTSSGNPNLADAAGAQRLTISVSVTYVNTKDEVFNFNNKSFSFYEDFDATSTTLTAVEDQLIETISDQIIIDIFNATVANW
ncbi:LptE family protein [Marivirga arenosa]|uniref:LptE family protein n=1 Tax=Marivirga arenosa TaxID=3059076 RepID=A0AA49JCG5_9BACT|nr:LptE family protein [Marivirga sp. BKB1-2]WKK80155.1 LptE family protein [Marivirga sp. BKB1-2]